MLGAGGPVSTTPSSRPRCLDRSAQQTLRPQFFEVRQVLLQVLDRVRMIVDLALDQEIVELKARQPEQLAGLMVGERPGAVAFDGESFERFAPRIGVPRYVVWQLDGDLHGSRIADGLARYGNSHRVALTGKSFSRHANT